MKFECKKISISDEGFGCTLTLSDEEENRYVENMTTEELMNSSEQYILLQRTYGEDEFENDHYYIETSVPNKIGKLEEFSIDLFRTQFVMTWDNEIFKIDINVDDKKFEQLKRTIIKITNKKGQVIFH